MKEIHWLNSPSHDSETMRCVITYLLFMSELEWEIPEYKIQFSKNSTISLIKKGFGSRPMSRVLVLVLTPIPIF